MNSLSIPVPEHLSTAPADPVRLARVQSLVADYRTHLAKAEKALREAFDMDPMYAGSLLVSSPAPVPTVPDDAPSNQTPYPVWSPYHPEHVPLTPEQALRPYDHANPDQAGLMGLDPLLAEFYGVKTQLDNLRRGRSVLKKTMAAVAPTPTPPRSPEPAIGGPKAWKESR